MAEPPRDNYICYPGTSPVPEGVAVNTRGRSTWQEVGKLGAIAVIRTFLNYFLEKDLEGAA